MNLLRRKGLTSIALDYPIRPQPRYGYGKPVHGRLLQSINARRDAYKSSLEAFLL